MCALGVVWLQQNWQQQEPLWGLIPAFLYFTVLVPECLSGTWLGYPGQTPSHVISFFHSLISWPSPQSGNSLTFICHVWNLHFLCRLEKWELLLKPCSLFSKHFLFFSCKRNICIHRFNSCFVMQVPSYNLTPKTKHHHLSRWPVFTLQEGAALFQQKIINGTAGKNTPRSSGNKASWWERCRWKASWWRG